MTAAALLASPSIPTVSLQEALVIAEQSHVPEVASEKVPNLFYEMRYSTNFWTHVFFLVYGSAPVSDKDKRWDELFKSGYPAYRKLHGEA